MRPTTESVELAAGFTEALRIAHEGREVRVRQASSIRDVFVAALGKAFTDIMLNGSFEKRLPNNVNLSLSGLSDPEFAVLKLDHAGIACSTKSSCLKGEESSYVVSALGGPDWRARNTLRFSLAPDATLSDIHKIISALKELR